MGCGGFSPIGKTHFSCKKRTCLDGMVCMFRYGSPTKKIIRGLKQDLVKDSVGLLSLFLAREIKNLYMFKIWRKANFVFIPVPLHKNRERWRGFNQSALLLEQVCERLKVKFENDLVLRARPTKDQTKLKARQRVENMENAFMVGKGMEEKIAGKNFIIFDDVKTTGATLNQCAKILKNFGAGSVWGLTLAG